MAQLYIASLGAPTQVVIGEHLGDMSELIALNEKMVKTLGEAKAFIAAAALKCSPAPPRPTEYSHPDKGVYVRAAWLADPLRHPPASTARRGGESAAERERPAGC